MIRLLEVSAKGTELKKTKLMKMSYNNNHVQSTKNVKDQKNILD